MIYDTFGVPTTYFLYRLPAHQRSSSRRLHLGQTKGLLHVQSTQWQISGIERQGGRVHSEVLVIISIHDRLRRVGPSQFPGSGYTVNEVRGAAVDGEVGGLVDERSSPGVATGGWGLPKCTAEVNLSKLAGI